MKKKNKPYLIVAAIIIVAAIAGGVYWYQQANSGPGPYDDFARCLTDKGVKMYGAYWCPHCQNQKELFGKSWQYVTYVECAVPTGNGQTQVCADAGISSYPTWEFAGGKRQSRKLTIAQLSSESGCPMPVANE